MTLVSTRVSRAANWFFGIAWLLVAATGFGLISVLQPVWAGRPELTDRFLVPTASAWLIFRAWPRLKATQFNASAIGLIPLALGGAAFAAAWYLSVQVSGRTIVVWWLTIGFILLTLGLVLAHLGWRQLVILSFPLVFLLFSLPTPGLIHNPLKRGLQPFTTKAAEVALPLMGVAVQRPDPTGYTLVLPSGNALGVIEECSGLRSVTSLTAIAVLAAYLRGFGWIRGLVLVGLSVGVVAISNAARIIVTGVIQESFGPQYIKTWYHEALGIGTILAGFVFILGLSSLIAPRRRPKLHNSKQLGATPIPGAIRTRSALAALGILTATCAVCAWAEQFRANHYAIVRLDKFDRKIGAWEGIDLEIDEAIKNMLMCDQLLYRDYVNPLGQRIKVWIMFWANAASTADMHHPDICFPSRGWEVTAPPELQPITVGGITGSLNVSSRHYSKPQKQVILYYWTQEGNHVLPDGVATPQGVWGHSWVWRLFRESQAINHQGFRISVLIGTHARASVDTSEKLMRDFTGSFAKELYRICPWAVPDSLPNR